MKEGADMKVCVLNPYIDYRGGGEKLMLSICKLLEERLAGTAANDQDNADLTIDILVHDHNDIDVYSPDYITIDALCEQYNIKLSHTRIVKIERPHKRNAFNYLKFKRDLEAITAGYDLLINIMFESQHAGRAKKNVYVCMFPPKPFAESVGARLTHQSSASTQTTGTGQSSASTQTTGTGQPTPNSQNKLKAGPKAGLIHKLGERIDKAFITSYDKIINISEYTAQWTDTYYGRYIKDGQCATVWPGVYNVNDNTYDEAQKENIILSVGRFFVGHHCKKQLEMAECFAKHCDDFSNYEYHLCGTVFDSKEDLLYLDKIKQLAKSCPNIHLHVNCSYEELKNLYQKAKIFWHGTGMNTDELKEPEKMEHFGITTVEAMSYGAVPIVINRGGQRFIVDSDNCGYLFETEEELWKATKKIIEDEKLRTRMADAAVVKAKNYSNEAFAKNMAKELEIN